MDTYSNTLTVISDMVDKISKKGTKLSSEDMITMGTLVTSSLLIAMIMIPKFFIYSLLLILIIIVSLSIQTINSRACVNFTKRGKSTTNAVSDCDSVDDRSSETDVKIHKNINKNKLKAFRKLRNNMATPTGDTSTL